MKRPRVILLNQTNPDHPGCRLTCRVLTGLIQKYATLAAAYPTPRRDGPSVRIDYSQAEVVLINGEGTMHHHPRPTPRFAAAELHRQAQIAKTAGLRVALVNTVMQEFDEDLSVYDYLSARESFSRDAALARGVRCVELIPDACFHHLVDAPRPERPGEVIVTDSVRPEVSAALSDLARSHGWTFLHFKHLTPEELLERTLHARMVITGRYHGAVFALMTRTPVVCVPSNTHKIEGLLRDFQLTGCTLTDLAHVPADAPVSPVPLPPLRDRVEASIRHAIFGDDWSAVAGDEDSPPTRHTLRLPNLRRQLRRLWLPRSLRHQAQFPLGWLPESRTDPGYRRMVWRGEQVATARPIRSIRDSDTRDCFIVATGPSLATLDLSPIHGRLCIAVNGAIVKFRELGFAPDYFVVMDGDFVRNRFGLVGQGLASGAACVMPCELAMQVCERDPRALGGAPIYLMDMIGEAFGQPRFTPQQWRAMKYDPDLLLHPTARTGGRPIGFARDLSRGRFPCRTVVHPALQLAYHLGSRRVFILGMDLGSIPGEPVRFYESTGDSRPSRLEQYLDSYIVPAFEMVREVNRHERFEVYNVCPTSRLPDHVLPKITMDQARAMLT